MKAGYLLIDIKFTDWISYYNVFYKYYVKYNSKAMKSFLWIM